MSTLVERQPIIAQVSQNEMLHFCRRVCVVVAEWRSRARQRESLAKLDDHLLADIGLTREIQLAECSKPFWCP
jgi:uncharacterized protein YjiS (DUF1127 family)